MEQLPNRSNESGKSSSIELVLVLNTMANGDIFRLFHPGLAAREDCHSVAASETEPVYNVTAGEIAMALHSQSQSDTPY